MQSKLISFMSYLNGGNAKYVTCFNMLGVGGFASLIALIAPVTT